MAKSLSKGKKLDMILSELAKMKGEMKTLVKQHDSLAASIAKLSAPKPSKPAKKIKSPPATTAAKRPARATEARKRPVLVKTSDTAVAEGRSSSQG
jgi:hypothetical protein